LGANQAGPEETGPRRGGVVVRDLFKSYRKVAAVRGVSLEVRPGEIVGLLGPNGAGKTTTVESIVGLTIPDRGEVTVAGIDARRRPRQARRRIGLVLQTTGLPDAATSREALEAFAALYGVRLDAGRWLERYGLAEKAGARVATLSGGQKQRLALAIAFIGDPDVVILDEPTVGLDPAARRELMQQMADMRGEGRAVLLTTHDMEEAAQLCDRVVVINHGQVVAQGSPGELISDVSQTAGVEFATDRPVSTRRLRAHPKVAGLVSDGTAVRFTTDDVAAVLPEIADLARQDGAAILSLKASRGTLEDVILRLTAKTP
jgi:ABC-2 type transport system ATP-binding protein